jgi:putative phosphoribosyl transferase
MTDAAQPRGFRDRRDAGRALARRLHAERIGDAVVVGLARGGVIVAAEVARELGLPLDALAVRKVRHPLQPEYGIGAVTPGGATYLRPPSGLSEAQVDAAVAHALAGADELERRIHLRRPAVDVAGRPCVLVDDGLATGGSMVAALRWARACGATMVVAAAPVAPPETVELLCAEADAVVCVELPGVLFSVGEWYEDFRQVEEEEVVELLLGTGSAGARSVRIDTDGVAIGGDLVLPAAAGGIVVFAHGSGSSRHSPRNRAVARRLNDAGLGTLLIDLLTPAEAADRRRVFDIPLLARRLAAAHRWLALDAASREQPVGYFGASTGAAAALWAAADDPSVAAVVARGGRPDLAGPRIGAVRVPTLLIVGGDDTPVLDLNRSAATRLGGPCDVVVVPGATHLFEEPGALERVAELAAGWFARNLTAAHPRPHRG